MKSIPILRVLHRAPSFALVVFLLVAAVTAVNATVFDALGTLRWKPLPYAADDSLVWLKLRLAKINNESSLSEHYRGELARDKTIFRGVAGFVDANRTRSDDAGRAWRIAQVTPQLDAVLGVAPQLGRGIEAADAAAGADHVLVISDAVWRRRFHADPQILGRSVHFGERTDTIIGVMPPGFAFPDTQTDAWRPFVRPLPLSAIDGVGELEVIARLAPGASMEQARLALDNVYADGKDLGPLRAMFASMDPQPHAEPWRAHFAARHGPALAMLQLAGLILLLAVGANLVNLQLDRLLQRSSEFDIRRALGAGEGSVAWLALADLLVPTLAGVGTGLALVGPGLQLLAARRLLPEGMPIEANVGTMALASGGAITAAVLLTGLVAARLLRHRSGLSRQGRAHGMGRLRPALLVGQVALTTALLGCAALLLRSALNVLDVDAGFNAQGVLMTGIDLATPARLRPDYDPRHDGGLKSAIDDLMRDAAALPGVQHVATADISPFSGGDSFSEAQVPGQPGLQQLRTRTVSPDYFATLGIPLLRGRGFDSRARAGDGPSPAIVDESYVRRYLGNSDPLQASVGIDFRSPQDMATPTAPRLMSPIVGVVHEVKTASLEEHDGMPTVYRSSAIPDPRFILLLRADGEVAALAEPVRRLVAHRMPDALIAFNQPLAQRVEASFAARRGLVETIGAFAVVTLALAALGLAAVLGFAVRRRTAELGVRMALGATPSGVRKLVLRQGGRLIIAGLAAGTLMGLTAARLVADRLFGVGYADPASWSGAMGVVALVALIACWLPARRAAATDPVEALRHE
ncbi:FtsX-like permease family protein [Dokdonella sp.]|uniref:FtsX-like permease family protein n=1 Tax=Dokdonella sp. TaxID=2291710 RepID=UPI0031BEE48E|nr:ABC transporter permease [Dokdonella sp.]